MNDDFDGFDFIRQICLRIVNGFFNAIDFVLMCIAGVAVLIEAVILTIIDDVKMAFCKLTGQEINREE